MVKVLQVFSVAIASAAHDESSDESSLLQLASNFQSADSMGHRIFVAVANGKDTVCVSAARGDSAPVSGSFTAKMSQQAVEVPAGSVAEEEGSFCVPKQDVLLLQRTLGLNSARDFDAALGTKGEKVRTPKPPTSCSVKCRYGNCQCTGSFIEPCSKLSCVKAEDSMVVTLPNATNWATFDWYGRNRKVVVEHCPDVALMQTMDATVTNKGKATLLDADQKRVCACKNFMYSKRSDGQPLNTFQQCPFAGGRITSEDWQCVQTHGWAKCGQKDHAPSAWAAWAKSLNDPKSARMNDWQRSGVTGWEHCDKSYVVEGACAVALKEER